VIFSFTLTGWGRLCILAMKTPRGIGGTCVTSNLRKGVTIQGEVSETGDHQAVMVAAIVPAARTGASARQKDGLLSR
jgi:hypothetical protein